MTVRAPENSKSSQRSSLFANVRTLIAKIGEGDLRKISVNTIWLVADKGIRMLMTLLVGVWIARYFGPSTFGVYSYAIAFVAIFNALATLGIDGLVVRDLVNRPAQRDTILGSAAMLKFLSGLAALLLSTGLILALKGQGGITADLVVILSVSFLFLPIDVIDFYFQSTLQSKYTILARLSALVLANGIRVLAIVGTMSVLVFGVIYVAEAIIAAIFLGVLFRRTGHKLAAWNIDWTYVRTLIRSCYGLLADSILVIVNMQIDRIIIESTRGEHEVGIYSVAVNWTQLWYFIPVFLGASAVPLLISRMKQGDDEYARAYSVIFRVMTYSAMAVALFFTIFSSQVIHLLYGADYAAAAPLLAVYIWNCVLVFHVSIRSRLLIIEDGSKYVGLFSLILAGVSISLNLVLVPTWGAMGAAISSLVAWSSAVLVVPAFFPKTRRFPLYFVRSFLFR